MFVSAKSAIIKEVFRKTYLKLTIECVTYWSKDGCISRKSVCCFIVYA